MPVTERRRVSHHKSGEILRLPIGWARTFGNPDEVDLIIDSPVVAFPPQLKTNEQRIDALKKIIQILEATKDIPYPLARKRKKK